MLRLVRGLISNGYLAGSHMSSPKFYSPTHSQSEMLRHIQDGEGNLGDGNEGEGVWISMNLCAEGGKGNPWSLCYC